MGNSSSREIREPGDARDNRQERSSTDYWRSLLPRADTSRQESDAERLWRLSQAVKVAHRQYQEYRAILPKLGHRDNDLADYYSQTLKAQEEALLACLRKRPGQTQMINHFEKASKPLLEFSQRIDAIGPDLLERMQAVEVAHRRYQEYRAILPKLGYRDNDLADHYSQTLKAQEKALQACLRKHPADQSQIIDHLEETSKPLLEFSRRIDAIEPYIETARQGFERFKESYEQGDQEWKALLANASELQLIYLGIKPCSELNKKYREILKRNSRDDFGVLEEEAQIAFKECVMIYSERSVKNTIESHSRHFHEYAPEIPVPTYLLELGRPPKTINREEYDVQRGLLFGFVPSAIEYFIKSQSLHKNFTPLMREYRLNRSKSEEEIEAEGRTSRMNHGKLLDEYFSSTDISYRKQHQSRVLKIIEKYQPTMTEKAKQYLLRRGSIRLYGFSFVGDPASDETKAFAQQIDDLLAVSGMNNFLMDLDLRRQRT